MPETNDSTHPVSTETTSREKFEQEKISRRAALRKIGMTTGMALFGMFAVDDLARISLSALKQHKETQAIAQTVAEELRSSGIAFAADGGPSENSQRRIRPCAEECFKTCVADDNYDCVDCDSATCGFYYTSVATGQSASTNGVGEEIIKKIKNLFKKRVAKVDGPCSGTDFYKDAMKKNDGKALEDCEASCVTCGQNYALHHLGGGTAGALYGQYCHDECGAASRGELPPPRD